MLRVDQEQEFGLKVARLLSSEGREEQEMAMILLERKDPAIQLV